VAGRAHPLVATTNEATAAVTYFLTQATAVPVARGRAVAFRRRTVAHGFRLGKQAAGLRHDAGRDDTGLIRPLLLALVVRGFVVTPPERWRGEKPAGDGGAGVPGAEPAVRGGLPPAAGHPRDTTRPHGHLLSPKAQRAGDKVSQETAA
jgi:hypothetical protein